MAMTDTAERAPDRLPCPDCARKFADANALWQHRRYRHRVGTVVNPHPQAELGADEEDSLRERFDLMHRAAEH